MQRVTRPSGGINEWLHWLPVSVHKAVYYIIRQLFRYSQVVSRRRGDRLLPLPTENGGLGGLSSILEADVKSIVTMARETSEKYVVLLYLFIYLNLRSVYPKAYCNKFNGQLNFPSHHFTGKLHKAFIMQSV